MATKKKDPTAFSLGQKGGKARAARLSAAPLSAIGRKGARRRWGKVGGARRPKGNKGR